VRIPGSLRPLTNNARVVQAAGVTLAEIVDDLERQFPGMRSRLVDAAGAIHAFVNIFVNDEDIRFQQGLATPIVEPAEVSIVPAMAGGA
jgi:molybdopterin converting factor small subunit